MKSIGSILLMLMISLPAAAEHLNYKTSETGIKYFAGGVGKDQRQHMQSSFGDYALRVEMAEKGGAYTADVRLCIYGQDGTKHLDVLMEGPILLVDIPAGQYRLEAFYEGGQQTRKVGIKGGKTVKTTFIW